MIKASLGKLHIDLDQVDMAKQSGFALLDFNSDTTKLLKDIHFHHKETFVRMLIAQSVFPQFSNLD